MTREEIQKQIDDCIKELQVIEDNIFKAEKEVEWVKNYAMTCKKTLEDLERDKESTKIVLKDYKVLLQDTKNKEREVRQVQEKTSFDFREDLDLALFYKEGIETEIRRIEYYLQKDSISSEKTNHLRCVLEDLRIDLQAKNNRIKQLKEEIQKRG